jgi:hypothetical protein
VLFDADEICDWLYYTTDDGCPAGGGPPSMSMKKWEEQKPRNRIIRLSHEALGFSNFPMEIC